MKNKSKILPFVVILCVLAVNTSCNYYPVDFLCGRSSLTEAEAVEIAKKRLEVYCEKEEIEIADFSEPEISKQEDVPWIIDYTSKKNDTEPYHFFRVMIDNCGRIEKSSKYYDFRTKY